MNKGACGRGTCNQVLGPHHEPWCADYLALDPPPSILPIECPPPAPEAIPASALALTYAPHDSLWRKRRPIVRGCIDYFYDALLEVSFLSWVANQKHNPGEELHWARGKSMDQADTLVRHLGERGGFDEYEIVNEQGDKEIVRIRHSVAAAWRALANLQLELEEQEGRPTSRGSRPATTSTPKETT